jgi:hypothetical protein
MGCQGEKGKAREGGLHPWPRILLLGECNKMARRGTE